ncbi:hypothetical protein KP78_03390 [Jeotgalibacillus soli]|uniref:Uncharacterized protein n=1 Tax=Jeotgalibacillus soli TaxID=889306 RepID=A0A0C2SDB9_9BACL|nr:hypothetical protein KP78_03390 [Jeotgalibacillus soli]
MRMVTFILLGKYMVRIRPAPIDYKERQAFLCTIELINF